MGFRRDKHCRALLYIELGGSAFVVLSITCGGWLSNDVGKGRLTGPEVLNLNIIVSMLVMILDVFVISVCNTQRFYHRVSKATQSAQVFVVLYLFWQAFP